MRLELDIKRLATNTAGSFSVQVHFDCAPEEGENPQPENEELQCGVGTSWLVFVVVDAMRSSHTTLVVGIVQEQLVDTLWIARARARHQASCCTRHRKLLRMSKESQRSGKKPRLRHRTKHSQVHVSCTLPLAL